MKTPIIVMGAAGRMGSTVARLAREDDALTLVGRVEHTDRLAALAPVPGCVDGADLSAVLAGATHPVIVDFTAPGVSLAAAGEAARHGAALVTGTTGWTADEREELRAMAEKAPVFWSPNMSVGVNALLRILPELARLLGEEYDMEMVEIHHNKKKDAPSGTALRLAEAMVRARGWELPNTANYHREGMAGERPHEEMGIFAIRGGDVAGVHTAYFLGSGERIEVTHHAHSRDNFARGALRAAVWLAAQKAGRLYTMDDMLR